MELAPPFLDVGRLLGLFGNRLEHAQRTYRAFVRAGLARSG
jgi:hypothetical protein